jgi:hypothetical protein
MTYLGLLRGDEPLTPADRDNIANLIVSQVHHIQRVEAEASDLRVRNMRMTLDRDAAELEIERWGTAANVYESKLEAAEAEIARLRVSAGLGVDGEPLPLDHWYNAFLRESQEVARLREVVSVGAARVLCRGHWDAPDDENYGDLGCPICIRNEGTMYRHGLEEAVGYINGFGDDVDPVTMDDFLPADRVRVPWLEGTP